MADDIDLTGEEPRSARERARQAREGKRGGADGSSSRASSRASSDSISTEIRQKFERVIGRIADAVEARGDTELATVLREDRRPMAEGIEAATKSVKFLRMPIWFALSLVEPILAFGRVGRILASRILIRRGERAAAADEGFVADDGRLASVG